MKVRTFKLPITPILTLIQSQEREKLIGPFCTYLNLHSLYSHKAIHNYKSKQKEQWLLDKLAISKKIYTKHLAFLKQNRFVWEDMNTTTLNISSKLKPFEYFNLEPEENSKMPLFAFKFETIEREEALTPDVLKTIALNWLVNRKKHAYVKKFFKEEGILDTEQNENCLQPLLIKSSEVKKRFIKKLATPELENANLYLQDIKKYFNFKTNSGASKLISRLKKKGLLTVTENFLLLSKYKKFLNKNLSPKTKHINGCLHVQVANSYDFFPNSTFLKDSKLTIYFNKCKSQLDSLVQEMKRKEQTNFLEFIKQKRSLYSKMKVSEHWVDTFYSPLGKIVGIVSYKKLAVKDEITNKYKYVVCKRKGQIKGSLLDATVRSVSYGGKIKVKKVSAAVIQNMLFIHGRGNKSVVINEKELIKDLDILKPVSRHSRIMIDSR